MQGPTNGELQMRLSVQRGSTSEKVEKWEIGKGSHVTCYFHFQALKRNFSRRGLTAMG